MNITINRSNWLQMQQHIQKTNAGNPQTSFADGLEQTAGTTAAPATTSELLDKLSGKSVALLKKMNGGLKNIGREDWSALMTELKDLGAITETDYRRVPMGGQKIVPCKDGGYLCLPVGALVPVPVAPIGLTHCAPGEKNISELLDGVCQWPGDPLEKLENMALYMRKMVGVLKVSRDEEGNPGSWYTSPFEQYESSYLNVLKMVRELMAAA